MVVTPTGVTFMDELSLLVDDSIAEADLAAAPESAKLSLPASDFTGSLDYIDSLASRSAIALSRRDVANITTAASMFDYLSPLTLKAVPSKLDSSFNFSTDFRPLGDARRFNPESSTLPARAISRASSRVVHDRLSPRFIPNTIIPWIPSPYEPAWPPRYEALGKPRNIWARRKFNEPNRVVICLKRKIRRSVMHSMGFAGRHYVRKHFSPWSKVVC